MGFGTCQIPFFLSEIATFLQSASDNFRFAHILAHPFCGGILLDFAHLCVHFEGVFTQQMRCCRVCVLSVEPSPARHTIMNAIFEYHTT